MRLSKYYPKDVVIEEIMSTIKINGFECRYEVSGNLEAKDTIIFVNGIANSLETWNLVKECLQKCYKIVTYDLRGQWFSEVTNDIPYSFRGMADDLDALMNALSIENAHLVGTSLGGEIILWYALMYPQKVKSLSAVASVSEVTSLLQRQVGRWRTIALEALQEIDETNGEKAVLKKWGHKFYQGAIPELYANSFLEENYDVVEQRDMVFQENCHRDFFRGHVYLCDMFFRLRTDEKLTHHLGEIKCPTLLIAGEKDVIKPPCFSEMMARKIADSEMHVIKDSGHAVINEKPHELGDMIKSFLFKHDSDLTTPEMDAAAPSANMTIN